MRVAFALDCHDREVIGWVATTAGISGEIIRDLMIECVEARFGASRAPHPVQWLTDNGSIYAAAKTLDLAIALNFEPCFTPVESAESNGVAEAFGKTLKRDYVRVSPLPDAATSLDAVGKWIADYNEIHPHSRLAYRSPGEYIRAQSQPAVCRVRWGHSIEGLLMQAIVHAADVQDRDGGVLLMASLFGLFPFLLTLYADSGYQGPKFQQGLSRVCA